MRMSDWSSDVCSSVLLYIALGAGLVLALALIVYIGRAIHTDGFDGAGYRRFIRGTRSVTAAKLARLCNEPGRNQANVAGIPMPTHLESLHLMIGGATGSGKSVLLRGLVASVRKRADRMIEIGRAAGRERGCQYV